MAKKHKMKITARYRIAKYNGDDKYSYAVFNSGDIKGLRSPIMPGAARPLVAGCTRSEAESRKRDFEASADKRGAR